MSLIEAVVMGLVQGLTEFLPVSSSGHLVLFRNIFGITGSPILFEVMVHLGTLVAVCAVFYKDIWFMITHPTSKQTIFLIVSTIPAVVVTLFFSDFIESAFGGSYLGFGFLLTAVFLLVAWKFGAQRGGRRFRDMGVKDSLVMGLMQAVALLPGISRSGSTLTGGVLSGLDRKVAVRFGFLMSVPAILGSLVFSFKDLVTEGMGDIGVLSVIVAVMVAAASGYFAIKFMLKIVGENKLWTFAVYVAILGVLVLCDQWFFHLVFKVA